MFQTKLFKQAFALLCVIVCLNFIGDVFYFNWTIWWYDIPMHFLAGVCVGMVAVLLCSMYAGDMSRKNKIIVAVFSAIIVGILWEFFELYFGITFLSDGTAYSLDTTKDMLMDTVGGFLGARYAHRTFLQN